jgi:phytoene dehydrogenase-like protein
VTTTIRSVGIIGGGISGMVAGTYLAQHGVRVRLYETRPELGGCCTTTTIAGYTFNNGALYLALPQILDQVFAALRLDRDRLLPLVRIPAPQTTYLPDGTIVTFGNEAVLTVVTPNGSAQNVDVSKLVARWSPILRTFASDLATLPFSMPRLLARTWRFMPRLNGTVATELARQVPERAARSALAGTLLYSGLPPERTPAFQMLGLVCLFTDGFHLPVAGMGAIAQALASALTTHGAEVHKCREVTRILVEEGRVAALEIDGQERQPVDAVLSSVSGMHTARLLHDAIPLRMQRKAHRAPLSHQAVAVQLGLRNPLAAPSHALSVLPWVEDLDTFFRQESGELRYFHYTVPTVSLPGLAPAGGSIIEMFPPIRQDLSASEWDDERLDAVAERAIVALGRRHDLDVAVKRVIGPRQYRNDFGLYAGAAYGLSPAADMRALFPSVTAVPGLYQAGQTSYPGYGVTPAAASGLIAARQLLERVR